MNDFSFRSAAYFILLASFLTARLFFSGTITLHSYIKTNEVATLCIVET